MILLVLSFAFSALQPIQMESQKAYSALRGSEETRLSYFQNRKNELVEIVFSDKESFRYRWMAFSTLANLDPRLDIFQRAIQSNEWFLRDIALKLSVELFPRQALAWSQALLKDPALVVRTTAVKNIRKLQDEKSLDLLWSELYSEKNFRKNQGLWVRKHILATIVDFISSETRPEEIELWSNRFYKILKEDDTSLYTKAILGLNQFNLKGPSLKAEEPIHLQRDRWISYLGKN